MNTTCFFKRFNGQKLGKELIWMLGHAVNFHLQLFIVCILGIAGLVFIAALITSPEIAMKKAQTFFYLAQHQGLWTAFVFFYIGSLFLYMQTQIAGIRKEIRTQLALKALQKPHSIHQ